MTSGGLTMTEGWNLQLQGRVRRLEEALKPFAAGFPNTDKRDYERARDALATISEADIAAALGEDALTAGALTAEKADLWRKKPVVVRAWQYDPAKLFPEWLQAAYANETVWFEGDSLAIQTLKGVMLARLGSWIIQGIQDELYPCKPDIFLATYEQDAAVAAEEQDTRNRVEPPSSARERRMEEALQKIRRTPSRPFPDPGAHSWRNWGTAVYRAWQDIQGIASAALSSDGRGREKDNTSNASEGVDPSPPASNRSEL